MAKVPKRKQTYKCQKCGLKMTKPWKRDKKYGNMPMPELDPAWNRLIEQEMCEAMKI
jgi:hypothetical protein